MSAAALLDEVRRRGVEVVVDGDKLRWRAPKGAMTTELQAALREHKGEVISLIGAPAPEHPQLEGGPAKWCDGVTRLDAEQPPADFPLRRWETVVGDARHFLQDWAAEAARLEWATLDLFGVHATRPYARVDMCGLIPMLGGHRIIELHADRAVIEARPGALQTFRRWPRLASPDERALIWELDGRQGEHDG